jgi:radical SAM superfamily enzyme YgiQ (UPF0313 family)
MNITLINPPITPEERYGSGVGVAGGHQLPLGVCYIAAYLRREGHQVKIIDAEAEEIFDYGEIVSKIKSFKTEILGITCCTVSFYRAIALAKRIKANIDIPIILGGPHVTAMPEYSMSFEEFDYGVLREGERTITELVNAIENKKSVSKIKGIVYRERKGKVKITKPREYIKDLDSLPLPARDLVKMRLYKPPATTYKKLPVANIITSRGCPNQCLFCDKNVFGCVYREHSAEYVVQEIEDLIKNYGIKEIAFVDDTFLVNKNRVIKIMDLMKTRGIHLPWTCMARVNNVDENLLRRMKESGCWHISYGIESGNERILKLINKGITKNQVKRAVYLTNRAGIECEGFFMLGHPTDTIETIRETIDFAKSLPLSEIAVTLTTPIPGTALYKVAKQYGTLDERDWSKFSYWYPIYVTKGLSAEYLKKMSGRFYKEFYFRPSVIWKHLKQIDNIDNLKRLIVGLRAVMST